MKNGIAIGAALLACAALFAPTAQADPTVLKFGSGAPARAPINQFFAQWSEQVTKASNGALQIQFVPNGVLGSDGQTIERVRNGVAQIGWDLTSYYPGKYPKMDMATLPMLVESAESASVAMWKVYERGLLNDELSDLVPLMFVGFTNVSVITRNPLASVDALKSLKLSAGGRIRSAVASSTGAIAVPLKAPDLYTSLQRGLVDGSLTVFSTLEPFKLQEVVNHGFIAPFGGGSGFVMMSKQAFNALPPAVQKVLREHSGLGASRDAGRVVDRIEAESIARFKAAPGKSVRVATGPELEKLRGELATVEQGWLKETPNGKAVIEAYRAEIAAAAAR